ncbi:TPA_asm: hypothetical protein GD688_02295, partial [Campylobacter jejuni]|nr:hypothetical protein [Campylobacter jejuni]HAA1646966.1 hypothetical protein [Campylobacter jejuni]
MNKTALTKTYTKDIQNSCLNSKKIVLSLAAISFSASCTHATLTPEIETYEEANRHAKARSGISSKSSNNNKTISSLQNSTQTVSNTGNTLVIESGGTITISNGGQQAVNFQPNSSTSTFLNQGTLIGGNNTASVQLGGANNNNGATIETFDNQGIIGNGSSKFGVTVWGTNSSKSTINNFSNSGTIYSNTGESIYFGNANISSFANSGTIKSNQGAGVNISRGTSIENFNNSGTIEGKNDGIRINANVKTLTNKGTIKGDGISIRLNGTIESLINEGIMDGKSTGIYMNKGFVKTLINKGTINQNNSVTWAAGIKLEHGSTIENIINTGSIRSNAFGISVTGGKFGTLTIKDGG